MIPPTLLLGCAVIFWGWQINLLIIAIPMALILETARWVNWRWDLSDKDFNRITDWSAVILVIVAIYLFDQESLRGLMTLLSWLPIIFFLLLTIQIYSIQNSVKLTSLFYSLRRQEAKGSTVTNTRINLSYPYIMMCLLAASVGRETWFFAGIILLTGWGLWAIRPQRYFSLYWLFLLIIAGTLAYNTQLGLRHLQTEVEMLILDWIEEFFLNSRDPYRQNTAIGDIGRLKQSDKILLRVDTKAPLNLRDASYNLYFGTTWHAKKPVFKNIPPIKDGTVWQFTANPELDNEVTISSYLHKGKGILPVPHGSSQISNLIVPTLKTNPFGAIKIEKGPDLAVYTASFGKDTPLDALPTDSDLQLPDKEKQYLLTLAKQLNFSEQTPNQVLTNLSQFFAQNFSYTLNLTSSGTSPLQYFLEQSRAGHCEYFATATTLLLRAAGIPSRYASGYYVTEYSYLEDTYIVRKRHSHAWTIAYLNGRWQEVDNTPAVWLEIEEEMSSWWQPIYDIWSWIGYEFSYWRWTDDNDDSNDWLLWLILPLILILIWRFYFRERVINVNKQKVMTIVGNDSDFYQIIQRLNKEKYVKQAGENLTDWLTRIQIVDIKSIFKLHQKYRFDPNGLNSEERLQLKKEVEIWLQNH